MIASKNPGTSRRRILLRLSVSLLAALIAAVLLEIVFRVKAYCDDTRSFRAFKNLGRNPAVYRGYEVTLRDILRPASDSRIVYELRPRMTASFVRKRLTTNADGFRSPPYASEKTPPTIRIIGLGDSLMFGWGVGDEDYYLYLLYRYLNRDYPSFKWEVINTAVPGYNTVMEVETLRVKGLRYDPDLVILHFVRNDLDLPNFLQAREDYFSLRRSFLADFAGARVNGGYRGAPYELTEAPRAAGDRFEHVRRRVPDRYKGMVGPDAYRRAITTAKSLGERYGFRIINVWDGNDYPIMKEICAEAGIQCVSFADAISGYVRAHGIRKYEGSELTLSEKDFHPSAICHNIYAGALYRFLKTSGTIDALMEQARGRERQGR